MPFDGSKLDKATKLLIEGRERIERGWCQGAFERDGAVCMVGAIGWRNNVRTTETMWNAYKRLSGVVGRMPPTWNDEPGRTKEEVLDAYDCAIAAECA